MKPNLSILPEAQKRLFLELKETPPHFVNPIPLPNFEKCKEKKHVKYPSHQRNGKSSTKIDLV